MVKLSAHSFQDATLRHAYAVLSTLSQTSGLQDMLFC